MSREAPVQFCEGLEVFCMRTHYTIEGFEAWAPELAESRSGEFYNLDSFKNLAALEDANFWFQARNELLLWALKHYFAKPAQYAEIGCGTGYVLRAVEHAFPETEIVGTELFVEELKFAALRCRRAKQHCPSSKPLLSPS